MHGIDVFEQSRRLFAYGVAVPILQLVDQLLDLRKQIRWLFRWPGHSGSRLVPERHRPHRQGVECMEVTRQPPDQRTGGPDRSAHCCAEVGAECVIDRFDFDDRHREGKDVEVSGNHHGILQRDDPGDGFNDRLLHLVVRRQYTIPSIRADRAGRSEPLDGCDQNGSIEAVFRSFTLEPLDDGDRVVARIFDHDIRTEIVRRQAIDDLEWGRVIPEVAVAHRSDERAHSSVFDSAGAGVHLARDHARVRMNVCRARHAGVEAADGTEHVDAAEIGGIVGFFE